MRSVWNVSLCGYDVVSMIREFLHWLVGHTWVKKDNMDYCLVCGLYVKDMSEKYI